MEITAKANEKAKLTLYLDIDQSIVVQDTQVLLTDIADLYCVDSEVVKQVKQLLIMNFDNGKESKQVITVLKIISIIQNEYPYLSITNIGESEFIVYYKPPRKTSKSEKWKIAFMCLLSFFGAAFSIMTYNTDVNAIDLFNQLHELFVGSKPDGPSIIQLAYSVGLFIGIIVFFNHGGKYKLSNDPTPL